MPVIEFNNIWEMYRIKFMIEGKASWDNFWALRDISFSVQKGEVVGLIGENGAGKSTVLKLIAGMIKPDRGELCVSGRVSGLLELGAGFQSELTGKENIHLSCGMFGLSREETDSVTPQIIEFADIGKFIHAPVKCYSQGMFVRLAFAVAIHMKPDILLIDDTLAVGDEFFQRKCIKKIFELKEAGMTIICVSHDMEMLRRLCHRVILLNEGRVIKDGVFEGVASLYTQTIGSRQGVGILKKGPLSLVFNNGQLFLNWQDFSLTAKSGAHTTFFMHNKWHNSLEADWDVKKDGEDRLVATGKFYSFALTQTWRLELSDPGEIKWRIEMAAEAPLEIAEGCTNLMLASEYTDWFTTMGKGSFAAVNDEARGWQPMLKGDILRRCIGLAALAAQGDRREELPALSLESGDGIASGRFQIFNSDHLNDSRILQYKNTALQNYTGSGAGNLVYFSGKIKVGLTDIDRYLDKAQDEFVLSRGKVSLVFNQGNMILLYDGAPLTKGGHISSLLYVNGTEYSSRIAQWDFKKENEERLVARGKWAGLGVSQLWELEATGENSFLWKVSLETEKDIELEEQHLRFMFRQDYHDWSSDYAQGSFPGLFQESDTDVTQRCITSGSIGIKGARGALPAVYLKFPEGLNNFAKVFNSDFYNKARILQIDRVEPEERSVFSTGKHQLFSTEILIKEKEDAAFLTQADLTSEGDLRFIFREGRGRIYWGKEELTKRLGFYTSLRSGGRWYDSASSAVWSICRSDENIIKVRGKWLHLPLAQTWEILLQNKGDLSINIHTQASGRIKIERLQTNLMLSEKYREWLSGDQKGGFGEFRKDIDDDWECLYSTGGGAEEFIGVANSAQEGSLPVVTLRPQLSRNGWSLNVVNSDIYHRGRVLQYARSSPEEIREGESLYFSGRVVVRY